MNVCECFASQNTCGHSMRMHNYIGNWKRLAFVKLQFKKPIGHLFKEAYGSCWQQQQQT